MNDDNEEIFEATIVLIDDDQASGGSDEATVQDEEKGTFGDEFEELNPITDLITRIFEPHEDRVTRAKWEQFLNVRDCGDVTIH